VLREGLRHHVWATEQLLDACAGVPDEELERAIPAIYGSALDTMRHLIDADNWYLQCISSGELGIEGFDADDLSFAELRPIARATAAGWELILERDLDPDAEIVTIGVDGSTRHATAGIRLAQVLHHGSDHRSQVCTALTTLGHEPPEFDVWAYGEIVGKASRMPSEASG
jgi:uncharacterized damage-inducible protein DinB